MTIGGVGRAACPELYRCYAKARPQAELLWGRASRVLGGAAGHDLRLFQPVPMYIAKGLGSRKWDIDGNEYIDYLMGNGALLLGHAHPAVLEAMTTAAADGTHFGQDSLLTIRWAETIREMVPSAERVRFTNSGTEATHLAIRLCRAATKKLRVLRFDGHFHGWHDDVIHGFHPPFDRDGSLGVPPSIRDQQVAVPDNDLGILAQTIAECGDEIACAIVEPTGASWGRVPLEEDFLKGVRELTAKAGIPLIFDEIVSGFRFAPGGAQEKYGVKPDLSCLAKIVAGGMAGGAVVGSAELLTLFDFTGDAEHDRHGRVVHFGTFNGAPVAAAAGIALMDEIALGQAIPHADAMAALLRSGFNEILERHEIAGFAYGPSSIFHVYFEQDAARAKAAGSLKDLHTTNATKLKGLPTSLTAEYTRHLRHNGVDLMSGTGGVVSAAHSKEDVERTVEAFEKTVLRLCELKLVHRIGGGEPC